MSPASEGHVSHHLSVGDAVLCARGITKVFPGTVALDQVDFNVYRGKVNVLIGENGAGKSTLMKILAGVEQPTEGRLLLEGREVNFKSPRDAARHGIGIVYQELNLFPNLSVSSNIFLDHEIVTRGVVINDGEQERRTKQILERLDQAIAPRALVGDLSVGQQQIIEIAKALAQDVRILIMDEPTSALSAAEVAILFRVIRELKEHGVSIIYISHKLEELLQIGDFVTVLRDGRLVAEAPADSIDVSWIVEKMVGREMTPLSGEQARGRGDELLKVEGLALHNPHGGEDVLKDISFSLRVGEITGLYGLMGAGRTELFECLMGMRAGVEGKVWLGGRPVEGSSVADHIRQGLMLVPEDRQGLGLVQTLSVASNITLANLRRFAKGVYLSKRDEQDAVAQVIKELAIKTADPQQPIGSLSGGNQQKVVIAKALLTSPKVLLLDEPTRGVDVAAKAEMFGIMRRCADQGLGIIFTSSQLTEILGIADRILVMSQGRITGEFDRNQATEEALVAASEVGHGPAHGGELYARK